MIEALKEERKNSVKEVEEKTIKKMEVINKSFKEAKKPKGKKTINK